MRAAACCPCRAWTCTARSPSPLARRRRVQATVITRWRIMVHGVSCRRRWFSSRRPARLLLVNPRMSRRPSLSGRCTAARRASTPPARRRSRPPRCGSPRRVASSAWLRRAAPRRAARGRPLRWLRKSRPSATPRAPSVGSARSGLCAAARTDRAGSSACRSRTCPVRSRRTRPRGRMRARAATLAGWKRRGIRMMISRKTCTGFSALISTATGSPRRCFGPSPSPHARARWSSRYPTTTTAPCHWTA
mmetsp:Transcript_7309/g.20104  ORF Transcript_7309/g.20104 Transcript_7309/m.20104 type:complete len:248 (+) Transcript_7309:4793-5536(+)